MELILYINDSPLIRETLPDKSFCNNPKISLEHNFDMKEKVVDMYIQYLKNKHDKLILKAKSYHFELSIPSCMNDFDIPRINSIMNTDDKDLIDLNFQTA